jgi:hypothetical protein
MLLILTVFVFLYQLQKSVEGFSDVTAEEIKKEYPNKKTIEDPSGINYKIDEISNDVSFSQPNPEYDKFVTTPLSQNLAIDDWTLSNSLFKNIYQNYSHLDSSNILQLHKILTSEISILEKIKTKAGITGTYMPPTPEASETKSPTENLEKSGAIEAALFLDISNNTGGYSKDGYNTDWNTYVGSKLLEIHAFTDSNAQNKLINFVCRGVLPLFSQNNQRGIIALFDKAIQLMRSLINTYCSSALSQPSPYVVLTSTAPAPKPAPPPTKNELIAGFVKEAEN